MSDEIKHTESFKTAQRIGEGTVVVEGAAEGVIHTAAGGETITGFGPLAVYCCSEYIFQVKQTFDPPLPVAELADRSAKIVLEKSLAVECPKCGLWTFIDSTLNPTSVRRVRLEVVG